MKAYVINLVRSPERRAHMIAQLDKTKVHYEIVDAVDVRDLDLSDTQLFDPSVNGTSEFADRFRAGSAGSALSHLGVYRRILNSGLERALVLEDDVALPADLAALLDAITQHMMGAEVVLLNFHSFEPCQITKAGSVALPSSRLLVQIIDKGINTGKGEPNSGGAYLITREACERMVRTVIPVRADCDDWPFFYRQGALDSVRCVVPMPVANSTALRTSNDYYRPGSLQSRVRGAVANARIPILKQALALKRRRNFQRAGCIGRTEFVEELPGGGRPSLLCRNP